MAAGMAIPESAIDPARTLDRMRAFGVDITTVPLAPPGHNRADDRPR